mgnify:CR=1 FL=1
MKFIKYKNIEVSYMYFYIHMITEIICFYSISKNIGNMSFLWTIPFIYDALAFVPQSLIGYFKDKHPKVKIGLIGIITLLIGFIFYEFNIISIFLGLFLICMGNAFIHVEGAYKTISTSDGHLSFSAIFVSGGSFGLILGKVFRSIGIPFFAIFILGLTMIPYEMLTNTYKIENSKCSNYNYHNKNINKYLIILLTVFIVIIRGYCGYGIPTSWNKTVLQTVLLYVIMGTGKALGGILSDKFGIRKIAILSTLLAIPFLCFGNNIMMISIIGVMLFSMTMSITLGSLVSVLKRKPGLAFGITTISLFLGTLPIFFIKITYSMTNTKFIIIKFFMFFIFIIINFIINIEKAT